MAAAKGATLPIRAASPLMAVLVRVAVMAGITVVSAAGTVVAMANLGVAMVVALVVPVVVRVLGL